ncbi:hypothetical protein D3C75_701310 [compost metagenome]
MDDPVVPGIRNINLVLTVNKNVLGLGQRGRHQYARVLGILRINQLAQHAGGVIYRLCVAYPAVAVLRKRPVHHIRISGVRCQYGQQQQ